MNARLRAAVETAKRASMPRDTLERAIKKGAGLLDETVTYETVTYEGFAPHRVPVIVECLTDNKNRTATTVRVLFRKGQLGNTGSVSWTSRTSGWSTRRRPRARMPRRPRSRPAPRTASPTARMVSGSTRSRPTSTP